MTPKGLKTKENLINSAIELFHEKGIHWVGFGEIGERVKISQSSLYKYFEDKDELVKACAIHVAMKGRKIIDEHIDPFASAQDQIFSYIKGNLIWLEKCPQDASIILALYYFGYNNKPIQDLMITINQQSSERLAVKIAAGIRENIWPEQDVHIQSRLIHSLLMGEMIKAIHSPKQISIDERVSSICDAITKLLK